MCECPHARVQLPARPRHPRPSPYMRPGFSRTFRLARWALLTTAMPESSPKSGWVQPGPRGEAGVCLGSPLNSLINLAQCFHFSPWPANPAHVCGCLSLCLPALHVSVSFCLILCAGSSLLPSSPLFSVAVPQPQSASFPVLRHHLRHPRTPQNRDLPGSEAPTFPPVCPMLATHSSLPPFSSVYPRQQPRVPLLGGFEPCVMSLPSPTLDPHCASHSGWSLISMPAPLCCPGHTSWPQARAGGEGGRLCPVAEAAGNPTFPSSTNEILAIIRSEVSRSWLPGGSGCMRMNK